MEIHNETYIPFKVTNGTINIGDKIMARLCFCGSKPEEIDPSQKRLSDLEEIPASVIDSFIAAYQRFRINPNIEYYWIPIEKRFKTSHDFVIEPSDISVLQANIEKILTVFVGYDPYMTISLLGHEVSTMTLRFHIPESEDSYEFGHKLRQLAGNILSPSKPDIIDESNRTYTLTVLI